MLARFLVPSFFSASRPTNSAQFLNEFGLGDLFSEGESNGLSRLRRKQIKTHKKTISLVEVIDLLKVYSPVNHAGSPQGFSQIFTNSSLTQVQVLID